MRGVAIVLVVGQHWIGEHYGFWRGAGAGVEVFFVLSGFMVTSWLMRSTFGYRAFLRRRVLRLVPSLLVMIAGGLLLAAVLPWSWVPERIALRSATIAVSELTSLVSAGGIDMRPFGITWSLSIEWYFYLLWPVVALTWRRRGTDPARCARYTLVAALLLYAVSLTFSASWYHFGPVSRFGLLLLGASVAYRVAAIRAGNGAFRWTPPGWTAGLAVVAIVAWKLAGPDQDSLWYRFVGTPLTVTATLAVVVVGMTQPDAVAIRALSSRLLVGLGAVSYSLFLWHTIPWTLLTPRSTGLTYEQLLPIWAGATVLLTAGAYLLVERPTQRWGRRDPRPWREVLVGVRFAARHPRRGLPLLFTPPASPAVPAGPR
ncbi:hypothetical protein Acsp07_13900 [Actinomycetospora sp. NBRC 106378]|nr:hypothetical protein Acsp07_13900 [Actinomycetospora sp. NBRC 106378]